MCVWEVTPSGAQQGFWRALGGLWLGYRDPGEEGHGKPAAHWYLHYCCHHHWCLGTPGSEGRSLKGRVAGTLQACLVYGCVGLSPRSPQLLMSLGAGGGLLSGKWHVRNMSLYLCIPVSTFSNPVPSQLCPHLPSVRSSQLQEATRLARQLPWAQDSSASSSLSL